MTVMEYRLKNLWGEPVAFWALIQTILVAADAFGWLEFIGIHGQDDMAKIVVLVSALAAVHLALFTHKTLLGPIVQVVQALVGVLVIYGTHISAEQTAMIVSVITAAAAAWHRERVTPLSRADVTLAT
jgi:hypothetical protein